MSPLQVAAPVNRLYDEILADSPVCYWRLNEAVGATTAVDHQGVASGTYQSGNENGIGRQGPTQGDPTAGSIGVELNLTAITLTSAAGLGVGPPFTIEFMAMTLAAAAGSFVQFTDPSSPYDGYAIGYGHITAGELDVWDSVAAVDRAAGFTINDGNWHHIAVTFSGTTVTFYKDGAFAGTVTLSGAPTAYSGTGMFLLDAGGTIGHPLFMSECAVYNGALSVSRIADMRKQPCSMRSLIASR